MWDIKSKYNELRGNGVKDILLFKVGNHYLALGDDARKVQQCTDLIMTRNYKMNELITSFAYVHFNYYICKIKNAGHAVRVIEQNRTHKKFIVYGRK